MRHSTALARVVRAAAPFGLALFGAVFGAACAEDAHEGGLTAHIVFPKATLGASTSGLTLDRREQGAAAIGTSKQGLRTAEVPEEIATLQIVALDAKGSTLTRANGEACRTELSVTAPDGPNRLLPAGGTWRLDGVPIGTGRQLVAHAFLGPSSDTRVSNLLLYTGRIANIVVRSGEVTTAGVLTMQLRPGLRYPPLDDTPPASPTPASATSLPEGGALTVQFTRPTDDDVEGYLVAIADVGTATTPSIPRGSSPGPGDTLAPGVRVVRQLRSPTPEPIEITGLEDGTSYRVLVYAYDGDLDHNPLNYSRPALAFGIPEDSVPPGAIDDLSATAGGTNAVTFGFTAPGEDGDQGTADHYEVRVSSTRDDLATPGTFVGLPAVTPPAPKAAGEQVRFTRAYAELGVTPPSPFFLGIRAVDAAGNDGPIAIFAYVATSTTPPEVTSVAPPIGIVGSLLTIRGTGFGPATGSVTLSGSALAVARWTDTEITGTIPSGARSGQLVVTRPDARASAGRFLAAVARVEGVLGRFSPPFELVSADASAASAVSALYRETDTGAEYEGAVERIFGTSNENHPLLAARSSDRSTAIAGTYAEAADTFVFLASSSTTSMTAAFVSSSTASANALRVDGAVLAGGADHLALVALDGPANEVPALIAFSRDGVIRTAEVTDLRTEPFVRFDVLSSGTSSTSYDRVTLARSGAGDVVMAFRALDTMTGSAKLTLATRDAGGFVERPSMLAPHVGDAIELLAVPGSMVAADRFVVVYEEADPITNATDIRILDFDGYGLGSGYAPFEADATASWRLEDAGLVWHGSEPWIAVLASKLGASAELRYTEVPASALALDDTSRGLYPGVALDHAPTSTHGRVGCRLAPLAECPMVWLGDAAQVLFVRR